VNLESDGSNDGIDGIFVIDNDSHDGICGIGVIGFDSHNFIAGDGVDYMTEGGNDVMDSHRNGNSGCCAYWGAKEPTGGSSFFYQDFMVHL
jgi:hypothetical protein